MGQTTDLQHNHVDAKGNPIRLGQVVLVPSWAYQDARRINFGIVVGSTPKNIRVAETWDPTGEIDPEDGRLVSPNKAWTAQSVVQLDTRWSK